MPVKRSLEKDVFTIDLNSFVRRTQQTDDLKTLVTNCGGQLKRKGRSRNWQLIISHANRKPLVDKLYESNEPSWLWLAKLLANHQMNYDIAALLALAKQQPNITLQELISQTNCTPSEGRKVLDQLEWEE